MGSSIWLSALLLAFLNMALETATVQSPRCAMYLTGQHPIIPSMARLEHVTHVALAFMPSSIFNELGRSEWPIFKSVEAARAYFRPDTRIMIAIGGWGDTEGFAEAAKSEAARAQFAENVARMVVQTGADGVDLDWEYPGGNGEDYKKVPNSEKAWEIDAYPLLLAAIRQAIGPRKLISAAVPGLPRDMLAFTQETVPNIMRQVDFLNVMTYDLMNRRDNVTKHHTGIALSIESLDAYIAAGAPPQALNLGLAFYVKWFRTQPNAFPHGQSPVGCPTVLLEDPQTGEDLGGTGGFSWHDAVPEDVRASFERALHGGQYDDQGGGYYFWDGEADLWWSFDTSDAIRKKLPIFQQKKLGGVFAWGLGEDAPKFEHLDAVNEELSKLKAFRDEL